MSTGEAARLREGDRMKGAATESIEVLCRRLWALETELGLLEAEVAGVCYWPLLRLSVFQELAKAAGLFDDPHPAARVGRQPGDREERRRSVLRHNPFLHLRPARDVVLTHPRKIEQDGAPRDIYTAWLLDRLNPAHTLVVDPPQAGRESYRDSPHPRAARDRILLPTPYPGLRHAFDRLRARLARPIETAIAPLEQRLGHEFGVEIPLMQRALRQIPRFVYERAAWRRLLRLRRAGRLFVVVGYCQRAAIAAARDLGIPVIELQHGVITPWHLGYSYPGAPRVPYSPDELWLYGPHWGESTEFPAGTGLRVIGAPFVTGALSQAPGQETVRDPHRITVLTQGVNGAMLCDFAADLARRLPDYEVVLRLHPNESDADYRARLAAAEAPANLTLSHRDPVLFELLAGTTWQIGVFSTALFDGMMLGARTLVLDAPGAEYMHPVIETGDALSVASAEEAARRLDEAPACTDPARYYAPVPESFPPPVLGRGEGTNAERPDLR